MRNTLRPFACLLVFVGLTGCASLPMGDQKETEIAALKQQLVEVRKNALVGELEVGRLKEELAKAKSALRVAEDELNRRRRDDTLRGDPSAPPMPRRGVDQAELEDETPPPPLAPAGPAAADVDPQELYDRGYTLFHQKNYPLAESTFRRFLDQFPGSDLADNALFWIGESHYAQGDYTRALQAFAETVARFPQGNKIADALLKAGRCLEALGRLEEAVSTYREVLERFPGSVAATGAQERLGALGPNPGKNPGRPA